MVAARRFRPGHVARERNGAVMPAMTLVTTFVMTLVRMLAGGSRALGWWRSVRDVRAMGSAGPAANGVLAVAVGLDAPVSATSSPW